MSAVPTFNQVSPGLYELSTLSDTGITTFWAGYFAGPQSNLGNNASTTAVWQDVGGFYLFLDQKPTDLAAFVNDLGALRSALAPPNVLRFVWITGASGPWLQWQINKILAVADGTGSTITWTTTGSALFTIGFYSLSVYGGPITYIADGSGGGIAFPSGWIDGPNGGYSFQGSQIAFSGTSLGAFQGTMTVPEPATGQNDLWTSLQIGLQYAAYPADIEDPAKAQPADLLLQQATRILFMPVFDGQTAQVKLGLLCDPLNPAVASRTALSLFPTGGNNNLVLDSFFRTTRGYKVQLAPLPANGALPDARFVLGYCPAVETNTDSLRYHFSPDGAFNITVVPPANTSQIALGDNNLLLGLSGIEYTTLAAASTYMIVFEGGKPAFVPQAASGQTSADVSEALTSVATTSHLTVMSTTGQGTNAVYFAQPQQAPLYSGRNQRTDGVLDFNPMPAFTLAYNVQQRPAVFPVGIYAGLSSDYVDLSNEIENSSLAPYRNYAIGEAYGINRVARITQTLPVPKRRLRSDTDPLGVTPQGLVAELTPDYSDYDGLLLGNMPGTNYPTVDLTAVSGMFKQTLQSNQLFFVAANINILMSCTSVRYQLTPDDRPQLVTLGVPTTTIDNVYQAVQGKVQPFDTEGQFTDCISAAAGTYLPNFLNVCGIFKVEMDGWTFQLSPRSWRTDPVSPTIMIAKFCDRTLEDIVNDTSSWAWPEVAVPAGGSIGGTQAIIQNIISNAATGTSDALKIFYDTVAADPYWNGFLFLNAPVDISEMPEDLKFITAGIDITKFYAHHVGFSQTPFHVDNGRPALEQTAAFGLIDYEDPVDLYSDQTISIGFKTTQLKARFANAALVDFSAEVELMLNQLMASLLTKRDAARGNNLIIKGSYQRVGGKPSYSFTLTGQNIFDTGFTILTNIEILSVQLITGASPAPNELMATFILMGNLQFQIIDSFDMFSYGPAENETSFLRFNGLSIDMQFSVYTPGQKTFVVHEGNTGFDGANSTPRTTSLVNNFPLRISNLAAVPGVMVNDKLTGQTPEEMGFTSIYAPLDQTPMTPSWYGLVFTLDLGTFGALTGSVSFKISILTAWSRSTSPDGAPPIYLGMKLPGIPAIGGSIPLQGVLKLGFRSFQFETYIDKLTSKMGYRLRLRRFALSVFVWSFPPGNTDIILFGAPGNPNGSLGWYAAYDSGEDEKKKQTKKIKRLKV